MVKGDFIRCTSTSHQRGIMIEKKQEGEKQRDVSGCKNTALLEELSARREVDRRKQLQNRGEVDYTGKNGKSELNRGRSCSIGAIEIKEGKIWWVVKGLLVRVQPEWDWFGGKNSAVRICRVDRVENQPNRIQGLVWL